MEDINFNFNKLTDKEKIDYLVKQQHLPLTLNAYNQGHKILEQLKHIGKTPTEFYLATKLYFYMPSTMYTTEKLNVIKLNLKLRKQLTFPSIHPDYIIQFTNPVFEKNGYAHNTHVESGMQVEIIKKNPNHKRILTFNAFLTQEENQRSMRINNIQGTENSIMELNELSSKLGENWRIKIIKTLNQICVIKKIRLIGELPKKFISGTTDSEYERILRQYIQTYLLGGVKPENIDLSKIKDYKIKSKLEKIIINKDKNKLIQEERLEKQKLREKNNIKKPKIEKPRTFRRYL